MADFLVNDGENLIANTIFEATALQNFTIGLYSNNATLSDATELSDLTEVTASDGYASQTLTRGTDWSISGSVATGSQKTFTASGGDWGSVYGYFITNNADNTLVFVEEFSDGPYSITDGDSVKVTPNSYNKLNKEINMTGAEFYAYLLRTFKRTDKGTEVYEAMTDAVIKMKLMTDFEDFKVESYSTAITNQDDFKFALPSDFGRIVGDILFIDTSGSSKTLIKVSKPRYDELYPHRYETSLDTGIPQHYCIYSGEVYLGPIPDSTSYKYQVNNVSEEATTIVSGTASVPFTSRSRWILRDVSLGFLYISLGLDEEAAKWVARGQEGIGLLAMSEEHNAEATEMVEYIDV